RLTRGEEPRRTRQGLGAGRHPLTVAPGVPVYLLVVLATHRCGCGHAAREAVVGRERGGTGDVALGHAVGAPVTFGVGGAVEDRVRRQVREIVPGHVVHAAGARQPKPGQEAVVRGEARVEAVDVLPGLVLEHLLVVDRPEAAVVLEVAGAEERVDPEPERGVVPFARKLELARRIAGP